MGTYHFFDLAEQKDLRMKVIPSSRQAFTLVIPLPECRIITGKLEFMFPLQLQHHLGASLWRQLVSDLPLALAHHDDVPDDVFADPGRLSVQIHLQ